MIKTMLQAAAPLVPTDDQLTCNARKCVGRGGGGGLAFFSRLRCCPCCCPACCSSGCSPGAAPSSAGTGATPARTVSEGSTDDMALPRAAAALEAAAAGCTLPRALRPAEITFLQGRSVAQRRQRPAPSTQSRVCDRVLSPAQRKADAHGADDVGGCCAAVCWAAGDGASHDGLSKSGSTAPTRRRVLLGPSGNASLCCWMVWSIYSWRGEMYAARSPASKSAASPP